ncbi:hypothetical protein Q7P35_012592 [Cladosporium inversicolor]
MAAMSTDFSTSTVPSYLIYREVSEGQLYDATAPLAFWPAKDSDELFDALRAKFPHLKSHSDRMRDATIEFLLQEREAESLSANVSPAMPTLYDSMTDNSPWQQSWPSASMTTLSSPEMTNLATPSFDYSPKPQIPHMMRQNSSAATPSDVQTPALDSMTSVFSLSTTEQPKQRVRRKMTPDEKADYRKRRIVKACESCSKRKRKCVHNQSEMESLKKSTNDKAAHKVTKPRATKAQQAAEVSFTFDQHASDPSDVFATDGLMGAYDDFTLLFDEPTLDFSFDSFMPFDPLNSNTKPDNFRQCVQNFNNQGSPGRPHWDDSISFDTNATASFSSSGSQSVESANNVPNLAIPHSSQITSGHESLRRCDLIATQSDSSLTSRGRMASAGQVDAHGIQAAANANSNSGEMGISWRGSSLQVDSNNAGGSLGEGRPQTYHDGESQLLTGGNPLGETALRSPALSVQRLAAGTSPQSTLRRHRTRSDGFYDPALQSELSSISATSSSTHSSTEHTATLEGRPTRLGGTPVSPQLSLHGSVNSQAERAISALSPRTASLQEARSAPLSSRTLSRLSPAASTPALISPRASSSGLQQHTGVQSALLARPSPFDRVDGTHARATELFRLKHRIPASLDTTTNATSFVPSVADLSAQANGGAYPRLRSIPTSSNNSSSSASIATQQQTRTTQSASSATDKSQATEANGARMLFTESDTRRYRDHHGRAVSVDVAATTTITRMASDYARVVLAVLALGVMLMSTSIFAHPSFMLLAVLAPVLVTSKDLTAASPGLHSKILRGTAPRRESKKLLTRTPACTVCLVGRL